MTASHPQGRFSGIDDPADVVAVIVTYNSGGDIDAAIESLRAETADQTIRVVIADNSSTDDTETRVRAHTDVILVRTGGNLGFAGGINVASAYFGDTSAILVMNPDAEMAPGSLRALRMRLRASRAGIVAPLVVTAEGTRYPSLRMEPTILRALGDALLGRTFRQRPSWLTETVAFDSGYALPHRVDWASGAALLIAADAARAVGEWDERFFLYSEEADYQRRVRDAGYDIWFEPAATVTHAERGSGFSLELDRLIAVNRVRYARKYMGVVRAAAYRGVVALHHLVRSRGASYRTIFATVVNEASWQGLPHARRDDDGGARSGRRSVLIVAPAADGNDISEAYNAFQWVHLLSRRHDVTVLTTYKKNHTPLSVQLPGVRVVERSEPPLVGRFERFNSLLQPGYFPFSWAARRWTKRRLASGERFDVAIQVIPVAMRYPSPIAGLGIPLIIGPVGGSLKSPSSFAAEEGDTPWYQRLRALDSLRLRWDPWLRRTYESADCVLGIAPYVKESFVDIDVRRVETMSEVALIDVQPRIDRSTRTGPIRLLHVGRTIRTKGLRDLIRAMDELRDLPVTLDVLGEGNDQQACRELIAQLGLEARITLHGHVPRRRVEEFYERADIFAFPSYREPGGGVIMEAMAYGLPLVVCEGGGPGAFVSDECAIRLPVVSPEQLAADCAGALRRLAEDGDLRRRMGDAARTHAQRHHLWSARISQMEKLWDELIPSSIRS